MWLLMHQQLTEADIHLSLLLSLPQEAVFVTGQVSLPRLCTATSALRTQRRTPKAHTGLEPQHLKGDPKGTSSLVDTQKAFLWLQSLFEVTYSFSSMYVALRPTQNDHCFSPSVGNNCPHTLHPAFTSTHCTSSNQSPTPHPAPFSGNFIGLLFSAVSLLPRGQEPEGFFFCQWPACNPTSALYTSLTWTWFYHSLVTGVKFSCEGQWWCRGGSGMDTPGLLMGSTYLSKILPHSFL